jgi:dephospho-CoA kinase
MHLIGLSGPAQVGKDAVAKYLNREHGYLRQAFADPVKRTAQQMFGLSEDETWRDELKQAVNEYWGITHREMFQKVGTEGGRDVFGNDLWIRRWLKFYEENKEHANIVVSDVRFDNEAEIIRDLGGVVWHVSSNRTSALTSKEAAHASEKGIKMQSGDFRLANDGSYAALYAKIDQLLVCLQDLGRGAAA